MSEQDNIELNTMAKWLKEIHETLAAHIKDEQEMDKKVLEMYAWFSGLRTTGNWTDKIVKYAFYFIMGVLALILAFKQL